VRDKPAIAGKISQLAESQHGYARRAQLLSLGVSRHTIDHHVATGGWIAAYAGVYAIGHRTPGPIAAAAAAVLACGDDAVLSHDSAAALWGLCRWPTRHEVIAPRQRRRKGIVSHRSTTLTAGDVTVHHGIPVTTPVRTICDVAPRRSDDQLLQAVDDARINTHLGPTGLDELLLRCPRLNNLIGPDSGSTRSKLERAFKRFAATCDLPPYRLNVQLHGYGVDVLFDAEKLTVELDGWRFHQGRKSHDENRERDTHLKDHGYDTIRITSDRLTHREAVRMQRILANQMGRGLGSGGSGGPGLGPGVGGDGSGPGPGGVGVGPPGPGRTAKSLIGSAYPPTSSGRHRSMKILVLTTEPVTADQLRAALPADSSPDDAEVMVVAPALHKNALRFWVSDADEAITKADDVRRQSIEQLGDDGVAASGDTGEGEPDEAIEDALKTFPADRILIFTHPDSEQRYKEDVDPEELQERFGVPVTQASTA
jgi:very-short-patch-repair endonuclease